MIAIKHRIIVVQEKPPERNSFGIIIPESARRYSPFAKVVSVGKKVEWVKANDIILMTTAQPDRFEHEGKEFGIINIQSVECKLENGKLIPVGNKLILIQDEPNKISKGGIHIPDIAQESKRTGKVIKIGDKCEDIEVGDKIYFSKMSGKMVVYDGIEYTMIFEPDIQCRIINGKMLPLKNVVIVKQEGEEETTESGIIINPFDIDSLKPNVGKIVTIGKNVNNTKVGDRVFFTMYAGRKLQWEDEDYILMLKSEILSIIPEGVDVKGGFTEDHLQIAESLESSGLGNVFDKEYGEDREGN